ncbi:IS5 family transposase, partial [bacterium]
VGRPGIPAEQLIKATLLQTLYSIRSERELCPQIQYNLLYRWFLDLPLDEKVWDHSTFSKNRERFAEHNLMARFFQSSVVAAIKAEAASIEHFSVDGSLIEAWASMKSFRPKDEPAPPPDDDGPGAANRWVDWKGEKRGNDTHESKTDPEARLARKGTGQASLLGHSVHVLMDNRNGLIMDLDVRGADGHAEREAALEMLERAASNRRLKPKTVGADKGYDDGGFLLDVAGLGIDPHVAIREGTIVVQDAQSAARLKGMLRQKEEGYTISQRCRKRVEEIFGWLKTVAGLRKTRFVGQWKTRLYALAAGATWNLLRLCNLAAA